MRRVGHDRRLPIVAPAPPESASKIVRCMNCDRGYRVIARGLAVFSGARYWGKRRDLEALHGHFFISSYYALRQLVWEVHCEHCHEVGLGL
jgi:hypothetical protein